MTTGTFCDKCKEKIERYVFYRKNCDEEFCSRNCLQAYYIENFEIRTKKVDEK